MDITRGEPRLDPSMWTDVLYKEIPQLSEIAEIELKELFFEDSSDINRTHWSTLISFIGKHYEGYDGFVILHGTDTMAYTASALSFGLQHLKKPVILTGSQVPMSNIRSDARRNLINAIEMATLNIPEVAICFNDYIFRGNRATKTSIGDFDAFASPNYPPLAEIGLDIELNNARPHSGQSLKISTTFSDELFLLKLYPNLDPAFLDRIDLQGIRALVIEAFGSGNFPITGSYSLRPFLEKCIEQNITLAITSQTVYDAVALETYESGRKALKLGALSAKDMTTEATLTKMMYLLGNETSSENIKSLFQKNLAGELTE